jgi:hypothetical protein
MPCRGPLALALACALIACAPAPGVEPVARLNGPSRVEPGGLILLSPAGSEGDEPAVIVPEEGQPAALQLTPLFTPDGKGGYAPFAALATAPSLPGHYTFACVASGRTDEGRTLYSVATWTVTVGSPPKPPPPGPGPDPNPDPTPGPDPPPAPLAGTLHLSYAVAADAVTPEQAAIRTSPRIRAAAAELDCVWHTYQSNEEDLERLRLRVDFEDLGYPALLVQDAAGRVVAELRQPSEADIIALLRRLRGKTS